MTASTLLPRCCSSPSRLKESTTNRPDNPPQARAHSAMANGWWSKRRKDGPLTPAHANRMRTNTMRLTANAPTHPSWLASLFCHPNESSRHIGEARSIWPGNQTGLHQGKVDPFLAMNMLPCAGPLKNEGIKIGIKIPFFLKRWKWEVEFAMRKR